MKIDQEKIVENIKACPDTIFDTIDCSIRGASGQALREKIDEIITQYGRINELYTKASLLLKKAQIKLKAVEAIAVSSIDSKLSDTKRKMLARNAVVSYNNENTSIQEEENNVAIYEWIELSGSNKLKEVNKVLDAARSLLSWDKEEKDKYGA